MQCACHCVIAIFLFIHCCCCVLVRQNNVQCSSNWCAHEIQWFDICSLVETVNKSIDGLFAIYFASILGVPFIALVWNTITTDACADFFLYLN